MLVESSRLSTILNLNDSYHNPNTKRPPQKTVQTFATKSELQHTHQKTQLQRDLNDWEYCKPDNLEDKLPQPFRLINKILYKDILLQRVFMKIDEIEKAKLHHNYEGGVREVNPVSFFEIDGTSCLFYPKVNPMNILITGDKYGHLNIMDLNRRIQLLKKEIVPAKRITVIDAVIIEYCDDYLITAAIITRGDPVIQVVRIWTHDWKPTLLARIKTARTTLQPYNEKTKLDEFPCKLKFSDDGLFLAVTLYNGSVELYQIPEPPLIMPLVVDSDLNTSTSQFKTTSSLTPNYLSSTGGSRSGLDKSVPKQLTHQPMLADIPTKDLVPFKKIALRAPAKKINAEEILKKALQGPSQEEIQAQLAKDDKNKKGAKKDTKKEDLKAQPPQEEEKPFQLPPPEFEVNPEILLGQYVQNENAADISDELPSPIYYADLYYTYQTVSFQPEDKSTLNREITTTITTGLVCAWHETCYMDVFDIQEALNENAPTYFSFKNKYYLQNQLNQKKQKPPVEEAKNPTPVPTKVVDAKKDDKKDAGKPGQQKEPAVQAEPPTDLLQPSKSCQVLYPITAAAISKTNCFVALGLADGSVVVLDLIEYRERYQLDKHIQAVTTVSFLDDWHLVSGSVDGGLNLHKFNAKSGEPADCKKYQHIFKVMGNSITKIEVSELGLGFVMDNQGNFRGYDLYHFEKIMKLGTQGSYSKQSKFSMWPRPLISAGREQLVAVCDVVEKGIDEEFQEDPTKTWNKTTVILIYRIFESLAILLPGIGSLLKKGFDRGKVMNAFSKISFEDLKNPDYDIPHFKQEDFGASKTGKKSNAPISEKTKGKESKSTLTTSSISDTKKRTSLKDSKVVTMGGANPRLTQEALHPEQFILQKKIEPGPALVDSLKNTLTGARTQVSDKALRVERLQQYFTQIKEDLDNQEHQELLRKRKEALMKEQKKKK